MGTGEIVAIVFASVVFALLCIFFLMLPKKYYYSAMFSGVYISAFRLLGMKTRKVNLEDVVSAYVLAKKSKMNLTLMDLETISLSGGSALRVVKGLSIAKIAKINITLDFAKSVDVSGIDIMQVVRECINPRVIELPLITASAKDYLEVNVKLSLSLKVNLKNFLYGVGYDTVAARGVEAVVTKIANTEKADTLVAHPELLDKAVFDAGIDSGAKYELISADVIHIDLGQDKRIGLEKQSMEQEHLMSMYKLEQRKAEAEAVEKEMKARAEELRAQAAEEEVELQRAVREAVDEGKIKDVVDLYKLQNLQVDTEIKRQQMKKYEEGEGE